MVIKLLVLILMIGVVALFIVKGPDGQPLMTLDDVKARLETVPPELLPGDIQAAVDDLIESASGLTPEIFKESQQPSITKVYKWQDENGIWQFSNSPVDKEGVQIVEMDGQINIIPAFKAPVTATEEATDVESAGKSR